MVLNLMKIVELVKGRDRWTTIDDMLISCNPDVWKLPCFEVEIPEDCLDKWKKCYVQYRKEMTTSLNQGNEGKNEAAEEVIKKYKKVVML